MVFILRFDKLTFITRFGVGLFLLRKKEVIKFKAENIGNFQLQTLAWAVLTRALSDYKNPFYHQSAKDFLDSEILGIWTDILPDIDYEIIQTNIEKAISINYSSRYAKSFNKEAIL